jgi:hypothetical protein
MIGPATQLLCSQYRQMDPTISVVLAHNFLVCGSFPVCVYPPSSSRDRYHMPNVWESLYASSRSLDPL